MTFPLCPMKKANRPLKAVYKGGKQLTMAFNVSATQDEFHFLIFYATIAKFKKHREIKQND